MDDCKLSFQDKKVFIGIDVHRRSYSICCICEGLVIKRCKMSNPEPEALITFINKHLSGALVYSVYEAGFSGFVLHRKLKAAGINNIVIHPASLEERKGNKVKTDKKDSFKLAEQLSVGRLKSIYIPSEELELKRQYSRTRELLVRDRTRKRNQIRMKLLYFSKLPVGHTGSLKKDFIIEILKQPDLSYHLAATLKCLLTSWEQVDAQIKEIEKTLNSLTKEDDSSKIYFSAPGIGPISGAILLNELGDINRFPNQKSLFSYSGLTPGEFSSGEKRRLGPISRQGSPRIRKILVEAAWVAVRTDPALKIKFQSLSARTGKAKAIVAVARILLGRIFTCVKNKTEYKYGFLKAA